MTASPNPVEWSARHGVDLIKAVANRRIVMSVIGLAVITVIALAYITLGSLGVNPVSRKMSVRVSLRESGGLLVNQDVTLRGIPIGRVTAINLTEHGVEAVVSLDRATRIPRDTRVRVSGLSAAGEQYLDFRPEHGGGPYLTDGTLIGEGQTTIPVSLPHIIDDSRGALAQLNTTQLRALFGELRVSPDGPKKLAAIFDGSIFLSSTLGGVLPQTVSLLRNTQTVFGTFGDVSPGLRGTSVDLQNVLGGVNKMDGGFRTLVDRGASQLADVDNLIGDNRQNVVQLLGNLTTLSQLLYVRVPALQDLWRPDHESLLERLTSVAHDNGLWLIGDIYPKYSCDYNLPAGVLSLPDFPEPYRYTYCNNPDPSVLVRGARNAPRPPGDDTAGPPPGYDPNATTDATPVYPPYTLPTTFGGPAMPPWIPN
ncbi:MULTISPECIES: MlaD family protein [Mycobacterium]|uniref:Mce family protein n=1 Tax=Mycobacterium kiyosense TaxID=2871094 RepID=A0A9P3UYP5_9MYCO|nr:MULTISPECIES: MlaD family protein [Mycobacterium]BDE16174.1 putative Mce family protein [Mycobacterium sp. 20KCMC460]GLB82155.1 putative Mce family protein [Mycobacterium kiyosense]GLB90554.1 putative Mce family protein [Mycobacterium kiyosense]GLB95297.1 putative Mce family protein [Mycobacterium kiyosense]GLC00230.1 putative Mce family protein [Mycobacterium kiyosense]